MKIRRALTGAAAAALLAVGAGAQSASAQIVTPNTGATSCNAGTLEQFTRYHGVICYTHTGDDDLRSSGFWTSRIEAKCNGGYVFFNDADGHQHVWDFAPDQPLRFDEFRTGLVSLTWIHIDYVTC